VKAPVGFLLAACYELDSVKATRVVLRDLSVFPSRSGCRSAHRSTLPLVVAVINVFVRTNFQPTAVNLQRVLLRIAQPEFPWSLLPGILTSIRANRPSNIMKNSLGCFFVVTNMPDHLSPAAKRASRHADPHGTGSIFANDPSVTGEAVPRATARTARMVRYRAFIRGIVSGIAHRK